MEKRHYETPTMGVEEIEVLNIVAKSPGVRSVNSNVFKYGGGSSTSARGNSRRDEWSDGWDE